MQICSIENCNNKIKGHNLCNKHLIRFRKYGNPLFVKYDLKQKICNVELCTGKHYAKGLCEKHYQRMKHHNDLNHIRAGKYKTPLEAYENQVIKNTNDECWGWKGSAPMGYGVLQYKKEIWLAHRFSYFNNFGKIPKGMFVCHKCDNPICSNPKHLFLGTSEQNFNDMRNKKRHAFGEKSGHSRLDETLVIEIINRLNNNEKMIDISRNLKIGYSAINSIKRNKTWKHIPRN